MTGRRRAGFDGGVEQRSEQARTAPAPAAAVETGVASAARRHFGADAEIENVRQLMGGSSCEIWAFTVSAAGRGHDLVLRRDHAGVAAAASPGGVEFGPAMDRDTERRVQEAVVAAGVAAPRVSFALAPEDGLGAGFAMERLAGETIARRILREPELAGARARMAAQCGEFLARLQAVEAAALPPLPQLGPELQLAQFRDLLDALGEPHPVFELAIRWLAARLPESGPSALAHGDFRSGNFVVDEGGIRAVLDWELAHFGDPMEDLGWLCVKAWRYGHDERPVGGFGERRELLEAYREAGGRGRADEATLHYWEVFGTLRWGAICLFQAYRHWGGGQRSLELAAVGRRACETELDLLALLG